MTANKSHIAIIDDEADVLNAYADTLESANYKVTRYNNGESAIKGILPRLAQQTIPDISVILCDIVMPGIDGPQAITHILDKYHSSKYPHLTPEILFMTAYCTKNQESKANTLTSHPIVDKLGLDKKILLETVDSATREYEKRTAA